MALSPKRSLAGRSHAANAIVSSVPAFPSPALAAGEQLSRLLDIAVGGLRLNALQGLSVHDLVPPEWTTDTVTHVWLTAYRSALKTASQAGMTSIDVPPVRIVFANAELTYQAVDVVGTPGLDVMQVRPEMRTTPRGFYTLFLSPFGRAVGVNDEPRVRELIGTTVGLVAAWSSPGFLDI